MVGGGGSRRFEVFRGVFETFRGVFETFRGHFAWVLAGKQQHLALKSLLETMG